MKVIIGEERWKLRAKSEIVAPVQRGELVAPVQGGDSSPGTGGRCCGRDKDYGMLRVEPL